MNMIPGFTAEAALRPTPGRYGSQTNAAVPSQGATPQGPRYNACIAQCRGEPSCPIWCNYLAGT